MARKVWNVAIIGPGWVAGAYVIAFCKRDDVRVTHVVGRRQESAAGFVKQHGINAAAHTSLDDALGDKNVDIVGVFTNNKSHADLAVAGARAGKHMIVEKPPCLNPEELCRLRSAVREAGVKTIVGFVLRWNPLLTMIRRNIDEGHLGQLIFAQADYLHGIVKKAYTKPWHLRRDDGGSSLLLGGCHALDAVRFLVGKPVVEVQAYNVNRAPEFEYPATELVLMKFEDGTIGRTASCLETNAPYVFDVQVFGTEGTFHNNQFYGNILKGQTGFTSIPTIMPDSSDVSHHPFDGEVAELIDALNEGRRPMPDIEDTAETMQICFAAEISAREGRAVKLPL